MIVILAAPSGAVGQQSSSAPVFKQEELDQFLAPIALHPDPLISQILMAATYPLAVALAERWARQNSSLKGDALTAALEKQDWDPARARSEGYQGKPSTTPLPYPAITIEF
jgi:hypothetical protein